MAQGSKNAGKEEGDRVDLRFFIPCLMRERDSWGDLRDEGIANIVKSPNPRRSGMCISIMEELLTEPQLRDADLFGALSCVRRWSKAQDNAWE